MSTICLFTASGREDSVSNALAAIAAQGHRVIHYDLCAPNITGCQGCRYCHTHGVCQVQDGLSGMYDDILQSDGVIAALPIYFSGIAGQAKLWLDRLYPMMDANFVPRHPGVKILTIYTQGDPREKQFAHAINYTNYAFKLFGWELVDSIVCAGTASPDFSVRPELIARLKAAGAKFGPVNP